MADVIIVPKSIAPAPSNTSAVKPSKILTTLPYFLFFPFEIAITPLMSVLSRSSKPLFSSNFVCLIGSSCLFILVFSSRSLLFYPVMTFIFFCMSDIVLTIAFISTTFADEFDTAISIPAIIHQHLLNTYV